MEKYKNTIHSSVALVIVTSNQKDVTKKTIQLLQQQSIVPDIIVVDNFSTDNTYEFLSNEFPTIIIMRANKNYGSSGGQYIGCRYAYDIGYKWIILTDNDAFPTSRNLIQKLIENADTHTVTQPFNLDEETARYFEFYSLHFACYHRKIIEKIGYPNFNLFLYGDDVEYTNRVKRFYKIKKIQDVYYSHPMNKTYPPNRFYFTIRNLLYIEKAYSSVINKIINYLLIANSIFIYKYIGEYDYYKFGRKGIIDFLLGRFNNSFISQSSKIFTPRKLCSIKKFSQLFHDSYVNINPKLHEKLGFNVNHFNCRMNNIKQYKLIIKNNVVLQDSIIDYFNLNYSFMSSSIVCLDGVDDNIIGYRRYHTGWLMRKILYLLYSHIFFLPLTTFVVLKLLFKQSIPQRNNYLDLIEICNRHINA